MTQERFDRHAERLDRVFLWALVVGFTSFMAAYRWPRLIWVTVTAGGVVFGVVLAALALTLVATRRGLRTW
jgi:hypothetical protein